MSTTLDMYLNQIVLVNGIPFSVTLPNFDVSKISKEELSTKLKEGYDDYLNNDVEDVTTVFDDLKKTINENLQNSYNKISTKNIENIFDYIAFSLLPYDSAKKQINKIEKSYLFFKNDT